MTAVQQSSHDSVRQYNPHPSLDRGIRSINQIQISSLSPNQERDSPSSNKGHIVYHKEPDAAKGFVVNGDGPLETGISSRNVQAGAAVAINGDDSVENRHVAESTGHNEQKSRPVIRRTRSNHDSGVKSGEHEATLRNGSVISDDSKDWGARHGFEEHYESEDLVAHLADVSRLFSFLPCDFFKACVSLQCQ